MNLRDHIRDVPDFPKKGILFKDITTLLGNEPAFRQAVKAMCDPFRNTSIDKIACIESRGFIFGAPMSLELGIGIVPLRKPGKLPAKTVREEYDLEYGTDALEMHVDAFQKGERILIVDDLLATGGTAAASAYLIEKAGGEVVSFVFLLELAFLNGREKLGGRECLSIIRYDDD